MHDRFHTMSLFTAVADSASFSEAARQLEVSPPAVTRAIASLEEHLGARLLHRTTRRVTLTEIGERYLADCRRILAELKEAEESAGGSYQAPRGRLSVTASVLFGQLYVLPCLLDFVDRHPAVQARTLFVDRVVNLVEEGLDVAVRIGELPDSSLIAARVGSVRRVVCASPEYLKKRGRPEHPGELEAHRLISAGASGHWEFRAEKKRIEPALTVNTHAAAIEAARTGWGVTQALSYQVAELVASGQLRVVLEDFEPARWPIYVLHQEGQRVSAKVRAFVDLLVERLKAHTGLLLPGK